jgi:hypothetical protein
MTSIGDIRHHNLLRAIAQVGSAAELASRAGSSPQYISQVVNRTRDSGTGKARELGSPLARRIEQALQLPKGWMDVQHPAAGETHAPYSVAQDLSHPPGSYSLPRIEWEQLMRNEAALPAGLFVLTVGTEAIGPDWPPGLDVVWSTTRAPRPGRPILVADSYGRHHVRLCQESKQPGQWIAAALSPHFASFDTAADEIRIVAVYAGRLEP